MEPYHTVLLLVSDVLPPNTIAVSIRRVNRAFHQRYVASTVVNCRAWLPLWAVQEGWREAARRANKLGRQQQLNQFMRAIMDSGDRGNLEWLGARDMKWDAEIHNRATASGNVPVQRAFLERNCSLGPRYKSVYRGTWEDMLAAITWDAVVHGRTSHLQLKDQFGQVMAEDVCSSAAAAGQLGVLRWARARNPPCPWDERTASNAARYGSLPLLQWLWAHGCPWDEEVCIVAARRGNQAMLEWAVEYGCPWGEETCYAAAKCGHLALLQWAVANGCPCVLDERFAARVAAHGQVHVLQWARGQEPPCPWDAAVTDAAVAHDQKKLLQWAVANGCPYSKAVYAYAKRRKVAVRLPGFRRYCFVSNSIWGLKVVVGLGASVAAVAGAVRVAGLVRQEQQRRKMARTLGYRHSV